MRIIAGEHRGRKLAGPRDASVTRPITDRVKQSLFDILDVRGYFDQTHVADIFCGTGSLGLEALSRGARHCVFVDMHRDAIRLLEQNLNTIEMREQASVHRSSALNPLWMHHRADAEPFDLVFLDPPYAMAQKAEDMACIAQLMQQIREHLTETGLITLRLPSKLDPPSVPGLRIMRHEKFSGMQIFFFESDALTEIDAGF